MFSRVVIKFDQTFCVKVFDRNEIVSQTLVLVVLTGFLEYDFMSYVLCRLTFIRLLDETCSF